HMEEAQDRATQITRCTHWPKSRGQVAPRARQRRPDACSTMWWQVTASSLVTLVVLLGQTAFLARAELRIWLLYGKPSDVPLWNGSPNRQRNPCGHGRRRGWCLQPECRGLHARRKSEHNNLPRRDTRACREL